MQCSDYLTDKYKHCGHNVMHALDATILKKYSNKMLEKTNNNIKFIVDRATKISSSKKYQISGYYEWKILNKKLSHIPDIEYKLIEDNKLTKSVLEEIIGRYRSGCCYECDGKMQFINKKVPVLYVLIKKI